MHEHHEHDHDHDHPHETLPDVDDRPATYHQRLETAVRELLIEIVTGRVHFGIPGLGPSLPMIKDGKLLPLAVVTPKRAPQLPVVERRLRKALSG